MTGLVIDASALAEQIVGSSRGLVVAEQVVAHAASGLHVPHLAIVETTSVLRAWVRDARLTEPRARAALSDRRLQRATQQHTGCAVVLID